MSAILRVVLVFVLVCCFFLKLFLIAIESSTAINTSDASSTTSFDNSGLELNENILNTINTITSYLLYAIGLILFCIFLLWMFHNVCWSGSDVPDYGSVVRFVHSVVDFWTGTLKTKIKK